MPNLLQDAPPLLKKIKTQATPHTYIQQTHHNKQKISCHSHFDCAKFWGEMSHLTRCIKFQLKCNLFTMNF